MANYVATAETEINASPAQVWAALTDPELIKQYMFGSQVETDWHPPGAIPATWRRRAGAAAFAGSWLGSSAATTPDACR
jgi:uncharacterized protein YndB with AHSA1/START domain